MNRHDFRRNAKAHRFVMNAPTYVVPRPQSSTLARRVFWGAFGLLTLAGFICFGLMVAGLTATVLFGA